MLFDRCVGGVMQQLNDYQRDQRFRRKRPRASCPRPAVDLAGRELKAGWPTVLAQST
jgi:hypothetical protein